MGGPRDRTPDDVLAHFGVKGMKWGVRRDRSASKPKAPSSDDFKTARANQKKGASQLSDAELKRLVERMNMERQYSSLNPSSFQKGMKTTKTILDVANTVNQAVMFAKSPAGKLIIDGVKKGVQVARATT